MLCIGGPKHGEGIDLIIDCDVFRVPVYERKSITPFVPSSLPGIPPKIIEYDRVKVLTRLKRIIECWVCEQ